MKKMKSIKTDHELSAISGHEEKLPEVITFLSRRGAREIDVVVADARIKYFASMGTDNENGHTLRAFGSRAGAEDWARSPWVDGRGAGRVWHVTPALRATITDYGLEDALDAWSAY